MARRPCSKALSLAAAAWLAFPARAADVAAPIDAISTPRAGLGSVAGAALSSGGNGIAIVPALVAPLGSALAAPTPAPPSVLVAPVSPVSTKAPLTIERRTPESASSVRTESIPDGSKLNKIFDGAASSVYDRGVKTPDVPTVAALDPGLNTASESYRLRLARSQRPAVKVTAILSTEGSGGVVLDAELGGRQVAVKTLRRPLDDRIEKLGLKGAWDEVIAYFDREVANARIMDEVLGPSGMAPRTFGEVDIGGNGNPSFAMEKIHGFSLGEITPEQARRLITSSTMQQAAEGMRLLKKAGWGGGDSPQAMVLARDQTVHGVIKKAGDVVFIDPGGLTRDSSIWTTPEAMAQDIAFHWLRAAEAGPEFQQVPVGDIPLDERARKQLVARAEETARRFTQESPLKFRGSPKHGSNFRGSAHGEVSPAPTDGQAALNRSVQVKETSPRRVGVDAEHQEIVILEDTNDGTYHGYVVSWDSLRPEVRDVLLKNRMTDRKGRILTQ